MSADAAHTGRLFLPVRRRLMGVTCAYLSGIYMTHIVLLPLGAAVALCALLMIWAAWRCLQRKSALFCIAAAAVIVGNLTAGQQLILQDLPSEPGVEISGVVSAIEKPYRVYLCEVKVDGKRLYRNALVSLMLEEDGSDDRAVQTQAVSVGQQISGTGRLFAPEAKRNPGGVNRRIGALCDGYELSGYVLPGWH